MTVKFMKKLMNLHGFVKQLSFSESSNKSVLLFKEDWEVEFNKEEDEFSTPRKTSKDED